MFKKISKILMCAVMFVFIFSNINFASTLDPSIPAPYSVYLNSSGYVTWEADTIDSQGNEIKYKSFHIKLLKRHDRIQGELFFHEYKDYGSQHNADGEDRSCDLTFSSIGYYRVKIRAVNLLGNYSEWTESTFDVQVAKEDTSGGGGGWTGGGGYGPGYNPTYNPGQYGPGYNQNTNNNTNYYGPGYNTGNNTNNVNNNIGSVASSGNYASLEVGWHEDGNGRYYYLGNGMFMINTWGDIGGAYYRFDQNGYIYRNTFFLEPANNCYYLLAADGRMLTGWQQVNNKWYYMNPNRGATYGVMYLNTVVNDNGRIYALNSDGSMVANAWYNGQYYGADGARQ